MIALEDLKQSLLKTQNLLSAWFSMVSLYFSILRPGVSHTCLPVVSPSLLFLCGLFLFFEIYNQIKYAILISPYNF